MISLIDKKKCVGCHACVQRCPKSCIRMKEDEEGFLYPETAVSLCIDCHLCERVCPVLSPKEEGRQPEVYAMKNRDEEVRSRSSSGGIFSLVAAEILTEGGVVFGARLNDRWEVVHDYTEQLQGLPPFLGSKYVQSKIGNSYRQAEQFLKAGRCVLFSGTPCQIAGLLGYLGEEKGHLITLDVICHGVPSPRIWDSYLRELLEKKLAVGEEALVKEVSFRNKEQGWKDYNFVIQGTTENSVGIKKWISEPWKENSFMRGFLGDLYLRPSCYACPVKSFRSGSDITLGDFWGIEEVLPEWDDDRGISAVFVHSEKGKEVIQRIKDKCEGVESRYEYVVRRNPSLEKSVTEPRNRQYFFTHWKEKPLIPFIEEMVKPMSQGKWKRLIRKLVRLLKSGKRYE